MYTVVNGQQFHTEQCLKMGKENFISAHKGIKNPAKVWDEIEKSAKKPEKPEKTKVEKAPQTK